MRRSIVIASAWVFSLLAIWACGTRHPGAEKIMVSGQVVQQLQALRAEVKFRDNDIMTPDEKGAMAPVIDAMLDRVLAGLKDNPDREWVIAQVRHAVAAFYLEDTEVREPCVVYLERLFWYPRPRQVGWCVQRLHDRVLTACA